MVSVDLRYGPVKGTISVAGSDVLSVEITKTKAKHKKFAILLCVQRRSRRKSSSKLDTYKDVVALRCNDLDARNEWVDYLDAAWVTSDGDTALQQAAREGHTDRVAELLTVIQTSTAAG